MASAELSRRVEKVVGYPPLSEMGDLQRREFHEALLEAASSEDLPGKWQAAVLEGEKEPAGLARRVTAAEAATAFRPTRWWGPADRRLSHLPQSESA
jgi:hypothetical protein